jgi:hypothetical protein
MVPMDMFLPPRSRDPDRQIRKVETLDYFRLSKDRPTVIDCCAHAMPVIHLAVGKVPHLIAMGWRTELV